MAAAAPIALGIGALAGAYQVKQSRDARKDAQAIANEQRVAQDKLLAEERARKNNQFKKEQQIGIRARAVGNAGPTPTLLSGGSYQGGGKTLLGM